MKKLVIVILIFPILLFSQEKKKRNNTKEKVDGYSGATTYAKPKGNISGNIKNVTNGEPLEYASVSLTNTKNNKLIEILDPSAPFFDIIPRGAPIIINIIHANGIENFLCNSTSSIEGLITFL